MTAKTPSPTVQDATGSARHRTPSAMTGRLETIRAPSRPARASHRASARRGRGERSAGTARIMRPGLRAARPGARAGAPGRAHADRRDQS